MRDGIADAGVGQTPVKIRQIIFIALGKQEAGEEIRARTRVVARGRR
jgi:hypothetical protein